MAESDFFRTDDLRLAHYTSFPRARVVSGRLGLPPFGMNPLTSAYFTTRVLWSGNGVCRELPLV